MIRFDAKDRRLTLSVRDLADEQDYRFAGPAPLSLKRRAVLGRVAHEDHQGSREEAVSSYRRERSVRYETEVGGWSVVVTGRIDGIYTDGDGRSVIEEVKTVVGTPEQLERIDATTYPAYTRQLQLYRHLLEEGSGALGFAAGAPEIALHLVVIALPSRAQRTIVLPYDADACRALVVRRLQDIIAAHEARARRAARRVAMHQEVHFPHPAMRPQQDAMVQAIEAALAQGRPILCSAPTGIGKTAAALVPALRHAARIGGRVFVATSKTTQQAIFARTVRLLRQCGAPVRSVVLTAREKACLNDVVHCTVEACEFARDYADKLRRSGAVERLLARPVADAESIREEALRHRFCPAEAALDLTDEVDVVIGDYNYVFDPGAALRRMFVDEEPRDVVLVIDEAHNLYERGMEYYSPQLRRDLLRELDRSLAGQPAEGAAGRIVARARALVALLLAELDRIERGGGLPEPPPPPPPEPEQALLFDDPQAAQRRRKRRPADRSARFALELERASGDDLPALRPAPGGAPAPALPPEREVALDLPFFVAVRDELNELSVAWFAEGRRGGRPTSDDPVLVLNRVVGRFVGVLELGGDEFSTIFRAHDGGALKVLCKDPSRQLGRRIRACAGAVAVSATLEPLEFYRDVLGFGPDAVLRSFPSPFDRRRRRVLVLDKPSTSYRDRDRDLPIVEDAVRAVLAARAGNYLVCCPSFEYMDKLAPRLDHLPGFELVVQGRSLDEQGRAAVLERLRLGAEGLRPPVVLLAVQGGIFTEGVDYPGALCVGAIIVGPGLPRVSYERELIQAHFERVYGRGFDYAFLYPGMSRVIQAAGRVIRTPTDEGVVVLVGDRFAADRYASLFPRDWYERHPRELITQDPYGDLVRFWGERRRLEAPSRVS